jgi:cytidylate kinase
MEKQFIVSIGREYGSGGHEIAEKLAKRLNLPLYDRNLLDEIAEEKNMGVEALRKYDETPKNFLMSRTVRGYSNSPEEIIARMQFDFLREKAKSGESFVVVGRCSEDILKEFDCMISFFILADMDAKVRRIQRIRNVSPEEAESIIRRHDKKRKAYHNYYCQTSWGDARNYNMTLDVSRLDVDIATDIVENLVQIHRELKK